MRSLISSVTGGYATIHGGAGHDTLGIEPKDPAVLVCLACTEPPEKCDRCSRYNRELLRLKGGDENMKTIKDIRKRAGLTQQAFGDLLGIPLRTIQNWEGGQRKCPDYVVELIRHRMEREESEK